LPILNGVADEAVLVSEDAHALMIIGLANYFAAALLLPYEVFRATAEEFRYDVERLSGHFEVGFDSVCHRLSTLQRPWARGVPFSILDAGPETHIVVARAARSRRGRLVRRHATVRTAYSHSIVPGGLLVTSSTTRLTSRTSFVMRVEIRSSTS
jgi:predicted transcriptional regulator